MNGEKLGEHVARLLQQQSSLNATMTGLTARLDEWVGRDEKKHEGHFQQAAGLSRQVAAIERDYVSEDRLAAHEREQREDMHQMSKEISSLKVGMAKVVAGAVVVLLIMQSVISWWLR